MSKFEVLVKMLDDLKYFTNKQISKYSDYSLTTLSWLNEVITKNKIIAESKLSGKDKELVQRVRGNVYWIDFGVNIGSEFNFPHFCVVIKEFKYTALVIPISTEKEDSSEWKTQNNMIIKIGKIDSMPFEKKPCYAMVSQMRAVSKQRLNVYKNKGIHYNKIKLINSQMDYIDNTILNLIQNKTYIADTYRSDYY